MNTRETFDQSTPYHIRLKGRLDPVWADWFAGFSITHINGDTLLAGVVSDQAALHGILAKIRDLGLPIQSIVSSKTALWF